MNCDGVSEDRLVDAAAGQADAGLREHLLGCESCRARFEALSALTQTLRESSFGEDAAIAPTSDQAIRALISRTAAERRKVGVPRRVFWRFLPLAAAAALLVWFVLDPDGESPVGPPPPLPPLAGGPSPGTPGQVALLGDVNGDGRIDEADADMIADKVAAGQEDQLDEARGDVNRDGLVNILDAQRILQRWLAEERSKGNDAPKH